MLFPKPARVKAVKRIRIRPRRKPSPRRKVQIALDRAENAKVVERSEGRCEMMLWAVHWGVRCERAATQIHHMIGGHGKRGIGISALAEHKQHLCDRCHLDITGDLGGKRLQRIGGVIPHWTDCYERVR